VCIRVLDIKVDRGFRINGLVSEKIFAIWVEWVRTGFNVRGKRGIQGGLIQVFEVQLEGEGDSRIA
jgi:hypothetical protein